MTRRPLAPALAVAACGAAAVVAARRSQRFAAATSPAHPPAWDRTGAPGGLRSFARTATGVRGAARVAPPWWEPDILTALAGWEPAPPRGGLGRVLAYLWAAPVTLGGLVAGAAAGVPPRRHDGVLLFAGARGLPARYFALRGHSAFTIGHVVVTSSLTPSKSLLAHELVHVRQAERFGGLMAPLYLGLLVVYGYARHPMERAARRAQRRALGVPERRRAA